MADYELEPLTLSSHYRSRSFYSIIQEIKNDEDTISDAWVKAQSLSKDVVIITPDALKSIFEYFNWGCSGKSIEKMCALMGQIYRNSEIDDEAFIVCVEDAIHIDTYNSTEKTLVIDDIIEKQITECIDSGESPLVNIGFIHSHPNELEIAMSLGDFQWHRQLYEKDWKKALTIILNPQKKHIAAYAEPTANHVELHLIGYQEYEKSH